MGALSLTLRLLRAYADRYPDVLTEVHHFDFTDPSGGLWSHESDVALVRPPFRSEGLRVVALAALRCPSGRPPGRGRQRGVLMSLREPAVWQTPDVVAAGR
jgi:hypothetical protein